MYYISPNKQAVNRCFNPCREFYFNCRAGGEYTMQEYGWGLCSDDVVRHNKCFVCYQESEIKEQDIDNVSQLAVWEAFLRTTHKGDSLCANCAVLMLNDGQPHDTMEYLKSRRLIGRVVKTEDMVISSHISTDRINRLDGKALPLSWYVLKSHYMSEDNESSAYDSGSMGEEFMLVSELAYENSDVLQINAKPLIYLVAALDNKTGVLTAITILPTWVGYNSTATSQGSHANKYSICEKSDYIGPFSDERIYDLSSTHEYVYNGQPNDNKYIRFHNIFIPENTSDEVKSLPPNEMLNKEGYTRFYCNNVEEKKLIYNVPGFRLTGFPDVHCHTCKRAYSYILKSPCSGRVCPYRDRLASFNGYAGANAYINWAQSKGLPVDVGKPRVKYNNNTGSYELLDTNGLLVTNTDLIVVYKYPRCLLSTKTHSCLQRPDFLNVVDNVPCCAMCKWRLLNSCKEYKEDSFRKLTPEERTKNYMMLPSESIKDIMTVKDTVMVVEHSYEYGITPQFKSEKMSGLSSMDSMINYMRSADNGEEELFMVSPHKYDKDKLTGEFANYLNENQENMFRVPKLFKPSVDSDVRVISDRVIFSFREPQHDPMDARSPMKLVLKSKNDSQVIDGYIKLYIKGKETSGSINQILINNMQLLNNVRRYPIFLYTQTYVNDVMLYALFPCGRKDVNEFIDSGCMDTLSYNNINDIYMTIVRYRNAYYNYTITKTLEADVTGNQIIQRSGSTMPYVHSSKDSDLWNIPKLVISDDYRVTTNRVMKTPTFILWSYNGSRGYIPNDKTCDVTLSYDHYGRRTYTLETPTSAWAGRTTLLTLGKDIHKSSLKGAKYMSTMPIGKSHIGNHMRYITIYTFRRVPHWQLHITKFSDYCNKDSLSRFTPITIGLRG